VRFQGHAPTDINTWMAKKRGGHRPPLSVSCDLIGRAGADCPHRWPRLLLENPLHHTRADAELPTDLEDPVPAGPQFENSRLHSGLNPAPAEFGPIRPRARR
jgi:hypothetical protein